MGEVACFPAIRGSPDYSTAADQTMKIIRCPLNGPRNAQEFVHGPEVKTMPDAAAGSDADWAAYVFLEENRKGVVREWWCHAPTNYWFIGERDTATDTMIRTYDASEIFG
jgi:sarcosine oxidase, subunit delta